MTTSEEIPLDEPLAARISLAVERYGEDRVAAMSVGLLRGGNEGNDILLYLGGHHAEGILDGAPVLYWPEVWGARALGYVRAEGAVAESARSAIVDGLRNEAWRVREMCSNIAATRIVGVPQELTALLGDDKARVRSAAAKALAELGSAEHIDSLKTLLKDPDTDVRRAAKRSLDRLRERSRNTHG